MDLRKENLETRMKRQFNIKSAFNKYGKDNKQGIEKKQRRARRRKKNEGRYTGQKREIKGTWSFDTCDVDVARERYLRDIRPMPPLDDETENESGDANESTRTALSSKGLLCCCSRVWNYQVGVEQTTYLHWLRHVVCLMAILAVTGAFKAISFAQVGELYENNGGALKSDASTSIFTTTTFGNVLHIPTLNVSCEGGRDEDNVTSSQLENADALRKSLLVDAVEMGVIVLWILAYEYRFDGCLLGLPTALRLGLSREQAKRGKWVGRLASRGVSRHTVKVTNIPSRATVKELWSHFDGLYDLRRSQSYAFDPSRDRLRKHSCVTRLALCCCCAPRPRGVSEKTKNARTSYDCARYHPIRRPITPATHLSKMYRGGWIAEVVPVRPNSTSLTNFMLADAKDREMQHWEQVLHKHKRASEYVGTVEKKIRVRRLRAAWDQLRLVANRVENILASSDVMIVDAPTTVQLKRVKNKRQVEIRHAYVTFEHEESRRRCVADYEPYARLDRRWRRYCWCCRLRCCSERLRGWMPSHVVMSDKLRMQCGVGAKEPIEVTPIDMEPGDIVWEHMTNPPSWIVSRMYTLIVLALALCLFHGLIVLLAVDLNGLSISQPSIHLCRGLMRTWYERANETNADVLRRGDAKQDMRCANGMNVADAFFLSYDPTVVEMGVLNFSVSEWSDEQRDYVSTWREAYNISSEPSCQLPCFVWTTNEQCSTTNAQQLACPDEMITWSITTLPACYCEEKLHEYVDAYGAAHGVKTYLSAEDTTICRLPSAYSPLAPLRFMLAMGFVSLFSPLFDLLVFRLVSSEPYLSRVKQKEQGVLLATWTRVLHLTILPVLMGILFIPAGHALPFGMYWYRTISPGLQVALATSAVEPVLRALYVACLDRRCRMLSRGHAGWHFWDGSSSQSEIDAALAAPTFTQESRYPMISSTMLIAMAWGYVMPLSMPIASSCLALQYVLDRKLIFSTYARYRRDDGWSQHGPQQSVDALGATLPLKFTYLLMFGTLLHFAVTFIFLCNSDSEHLWTLPSVFERGDVLPGLVVCGATVALITTRHMFPVSFSWIHWIVCAQCHCRHYSCSHVVCCCRRKVSPGHAESLNDEKWSGLTRPYVHVQPSAQWTRRFGSKTGLSDQDMRRQRERMKRFPTRWSDPWVSGHVGQWRSIDETSFTRTTYVAEKTPPIPTLDETDDKNTTTTEKENVVDWWETPVNPAGPEYAQRVREEYLRRLGVNGCSSHRKKTKNGQKAPHSSMMRIDLGNGKSWTCNKCMKSNKPHSLRCAACSAPRIKCDFPDARPLSRWEFLLSAGGGFSYDIRHCRRYDSALNMSQLRWKEVMGDVLRDCSPPSPRSQRVSRPTHSVSGSSLSAEQEMKLYGVISLKNLLASKEETTKKTNGRKRTQALVDHNRSDEAKDRSEVVRISVNENESFRHTENDSTTSESEEEESPHHAVWNVSRDVYPSYDHTHGAVGNANGAYQQHTGDGGW